MRTCPKCGKDYDEAPGKSRADGSEICRSCSEKEAVELADEADELVMLYTDPEEIRAIMEGYSVNHGSKNSMLLASEYRAYPIPVGNMTTDADWERDGGTRTMNGFLIEGKVPEFVVEDFKELAKEERKKD